MKTGYIVIVMFVVSLLFAASFCFGASSISSPPFNRKNAPSITMQSGATVDGVDVSALQITTGTNYDVVMGSFQTTEAHYEAHMDSFGVVDALFTANTASHTAIDALFENVKTSNTEVDSLFDIVEDVYLSTGICEASNTSPAEGDILWYNGGEWAILTKGAENEVLTMEASDVVNWEAAGGGGNKNREFMIDAIDFNVVAYLNSATKYSPSFNVHGTTESAGKYIRYPDSDPCEASFNWTCSRQYDEGGIDLYATFATSGTPEDVLQFFVEVGISSSTTAENDSYTWYGSTTSVPTAAWENGHVVSTWTASDIFTDGVNYKFKFRRIDDDGWTGNIYQKDCLGAYGAD